jgi:hypothetical protein
MGVIVANLLRDRHHRHQPLITRLSGVTHPRLIVTQPAPPRIPSRG